VYGCHSGWRFSRLAHWCQLATIQPSTFLQIVTTRTSPCAAYSLPGWIAEGSTRLSARLETRSLLPTPTLALPLLPPLSPPLADSTRPERLANTTRRLYLQTFGDSSLPANGKTYTEQIVRKCRQDLKERAAPSGYHGEGWSCRGELVRDLRRRPRHYPFPLPVIQYRPFFVCGGPFCSFAGLCFGIAVDGF
jgi:hypothetical protein